MNKFINETLVIYISKFTNTKVIKALKDGMMFSLPFFNDRIIVPVDCQLTN